ncbi:MAG: hypothetical protein NZ695_04070 [Dehalococcoidia bacterium]|jgi:hypothetical protein|nr:hypothetical protein [Dehalococcoidia bacterium]MDW8009081.1 hypothetical protein [Chloroflexota bacterium]
MAMAAKTIPLDRRLCILRPGVVDIRPSRGAVVGPLSVLALAVGLLVLLAFTMDRLPAAVAAIVLLLALVLTPIGGMGAVYSLFGSHVVFDARKQSARFQQGMLGLGLGTVELVPFWKIDHIELADWEAGETEGRGPAFPFDLRGWEIVLVKTSGKRLSVGQVIVPEEQELVDEGFGRAYEVAQAIAELTGRPLRITAALEEAPEDASPAPAVDKANAKFLECAREEEQGQTATKEAS